MRDALTGYFAMWIAGIIAAIFGGLIYLTGISAVNIFGGYGHGSIYDIITLIICILIIGFACYVISQGEKSSSLSEEGKKVRDMLHDTSGRYKKCPECTSLVDMEVGICKFCGYNLNEEHDEKLTSKEKHKSPEYVQCPICNHLIDVDFGVCEYCGYEIGPMR